MSRFYSLKTYPNKTYSTFGIKLKLNQIQDTFSNKGNFEIHLCNINLQELESQSKNTIIKNTPIFCYNQHSKQTTMAKLDNGTLTIRTNMSESIINKAKQGLINPCFVNLSFIPFKDSKEANNSPSQKIALTADDINKGYYNVDFKMPVRSLGEWDGNGECNKYKNIPTISSAKDRKSSIVKNTPAIFNIDGYEKDSDINIPLYQFDCMEEVTENSKLIDEIIDKNIYTNSINHNRLIRAIIYFETTHGHYDRLHNKIIIKAFTFILNEPQKSFRPMNINFEYWRELADEMGYTKEQIKSNKEANIKMGYELLKRIIARIQNPTIEKIGTLYNTLAKEKISSYGRILQYYYDNQSWIGDAEKNNERKLWKFAFEAGYTDFPITVI